MDIKETALKGASLYYKIKYVIAMVIGIIAAIIGAIMSIFFIFLKAYKGLIVSGAFILFGLLIFFLSKWAKKRIS